MNGRSVECTGEYYEQYGMYRYTFEGVTPQCMGDSLELVATEEGILLKIKSPKDNKEN